MVGWLVHLPALSVAIRSSWRWCSFGFSRLFQAYFGPGFWAFTFSYAAAATDALLWISVKKPVGSSVYAGCIVAAITILIALIGARTLSLLFRGQLFCARPSVTNQTSH